MNPHRKIKILLHCICLFSLNTFSQKTFFGEAPVKWQNYGPPNTSLNTEKYINADLVILNDEAEFSFYSVENEKITRNITFRINTEKGLDKLKTYRLPESFDEGYDGSYFRQGRLSKIKSPYISEFTTQKFSARKYSNNRWSDVPFDLRYEKIRWIRSSGDFAGEFINEDRTAFSFRDIAVGDLVQVVYEATFNKSYGNNLIYFHSSFHKVHC